MHPDCHASQVAVLDECLHRAAQPQTTQANPYMRKLISLTLAAIVIPSLSGLAQYDPYDPPYHEHDNYWSPIYNGEGSDYPGTPTAVTDGHPLASTTIAAQETALGSAFIEPDTAIESFEPQTTPGTGEGAVSATGRLDSFGAELGTGSYDIGGMKANVYTLRIPFGYTISERDKLDFSIPISITNLKDVLAELDSSGNMTLDNAKVYGYGLNASYTRKVITKASEGPFRWNLTPSAGLFVRESSDMNLGSMVFNVGLSSSFAYQFAPGWVVNMGNSVSAAFCSSIKSYPDPIRDEQQVAINGLQLIHMRGRFTYSAYVMDTRYLKSDNTYVSSFQSYAVSLGFKLTQKRSVKLTLISENGSDYSSFRGMIGSTWKF